MPRLSAHYALTIAACSVSACQQKNIKRLVLLTEKMFGGLGTRDQSAHRSQPDTLSFRHGRETECIWDLEDSKDAEITVDHMLAMVKVWRALESWMRSMPIVSFTGGRYDLHKPYLTHNYGALEPCWLRRFCTYPHPHLALGRHCH